MRDTYLKNGIYLHVYYAFALIVFFPSPLVTPPKLCLINQFDALSIGIFTFCFIYESLDWFSLELNYESLDWFASLYVWIDLMLVLLLGLGLGLEALGGLCTTRFGDERISSMPSTNLYYIVIVNFLASHVWYLVFIGDLYDYCSWIAPLPRDELYLHQLYTQCFS